MDKSKKRKVSEENRVYSVWTASFAFTSNDAGLPVCLICGEKLANNNKCPHFHNKHEAFAEKYPAGDERKMSVLELLRKAEKKKHFRT